MTVNRREMLTGAIAGAAGAGLSPASASAQGRDDEILDALNDLRSVMRSGVGPQYGPELLQLRQLQHAHLRATGAFPRFIEVGSDVWDRVYDWHVVNGRPIEVTRVGDRYQMVFLHTTLVLRPDAQPTFIGAPTDSRLG